MRRLLVLALLVVATVPGHRLSARTAPGPADPGPEQKRLRYFDGSWHFRLDMKPGPFGPGGVVSGTDFNELLPGGFFLLRNYRTKSFAGEGRGLEVLGWDARAGAYFQRGFDNLGQRHVYRGTVEGDTWSWTCEEREGATVYKIRITIKEVSARRQSYLLEISEDGKTWTPAFKGALNKKE